MSKYFLVIATETDGDEFEVTVPSSWVNEGAKTLFWPPGMGVMRHVMAQTKPKASWKSFTLKRVKHRSSTFKRCDDTYSSIIVFLPLCVAFTDQECFSYRYI